MDSGDWNAFRKSVHGVLEARAGKRKAQALLEKESLQAAWTIFAAGHPVYANCPWHKPDATDGANSEEGPCNCYRYVKEEQKIYDMVHSVVKYGILSGPRADYVRILLDRIANRATIAAARAIENAAAANCPTGRVQVTGAVLSMKDQETDFGTICRILVKDASGFKVWGTRPSSIPVSVGDKISFFAAIEPSRDDPKFGFYKRPTKAKLLETAVVHG